MRPVWVSGAKREQRVVWMRHPHRGMELRDTGAWHPRHDPCLAVRPKVCRATDHRAPAFASPTDWQRGAQPCFQLEPVGRWPAGNHGFAAGGPPTLVSAESAPEPRRGQDDSTRKDSAWRQCGSCDSGTEGDSRAGRLVSKVLDRSSLGACREQSQVAVIGEHSVAPSPRQLSGYA